MVNARTLEKEGYDVDFMEQTQPIGNIKFTESAIKTGRGYSTSLWTFRFNPDPDDLWLTPYSKIKDGIVTVDVATQDPEKVLEIIDKSTGEMKSRAYTEKSESAKELAGDAYRDLKSLGKIVRKNKEVMKYIKVRLFIQADTLAELDRKVLNARKQLEKEEFGVVPLLMEQQAEWQSMFMDYDSQSYLPNRRAGKDIPSREFGASFPANYVRLHDRRGQYLGISNTYGNIIFDPFELDEMYRNFYNILILGQMGFGKSTLMKKIMMDLGAKGYLLRGFDKSGEFSDLIKLLGGKILRLDGQDGMLNLFEIFATIMNESTGEIDQQGCFTQHVSKLSTWYTMIKPKVPDSELDEFEMLVHKLYEDFDFVDDGMVKGQVAGLRPTSYPILSDLIKLIQKKLDDPSIKEKEEERLDSIILTLRKLKQVYKRIFDGHTTFENLESEQVLFFNIDGLASMDKKIVDAQLFNATNLFWGTLLKNGKAQFDLYREGKVSFDFIRRSMIFIDECHNLIKYDNPKLVEYISTMEREGRKAFIGLCLATQSLRSLVPENNSEAADKLKEVFEFIQYRFYFYFPPTTVNLLQAASGAELTETMTNRIGKYKMGECLLAVNGGENYEFKVEATTEERRLFKGGGRNAGDKVA